MDVHLNSSQFPVRAPNPRKSPMPHQCLDFPRTCLVARAQDPSQISVGCPRISGLLGIKRCSLGNPL